MAKSLTEAERAMVYTALRYYATFMRDLSVRLGTEGHPARQAFDVGASEPDRLSAQFELQACQNEVLAAVFEEAHQIQVVGPG